MRKEVINGEQYILVRLSLLQELLIRAEGAETEEDVAARAIGRQRRAR